MPQTLDDFLAYNMVDTVENSNGLLINNNNNYNNNPIFNAPVP